MRRNLSLLTGALVGIAAVLVLGLVFGMILSSRTPDGRGSAHQDQDPGSASARPAQDTAAADIAVRGGYDPLSIAEQERALEVARAAPAVSARLQGAARTEALLVERHEETKAVYQRGNWTRRADVHIYDYSRDSLVQAVVGLNAGKVDEVKAMRGVQLPITQAETARAVQLVLADPRAAVAVRTQFSQAAGASLVRPDQLRGQAGVFRADSHPSAARGAAAACGIHRCAQLFLSTPNGKYLAMVPVVDLSTGRFVELSQ